MDKPVENPVQPVNKPVDEAARSRLRQAIVAEDGDEEQLDGVLRMLGGHTIDQNQLSLLAEAKADRRRG